LYRTPFWYELRLLVSLGPGRVLPLAELTVVFT